MAHHVVNISGGKDSAACYILAILRGRPFRAVMADTGNESAITYDWAQSLHDRTGGPVVEIVRADFTGRIARKRKYVTEHWPGKGVPDDVTQAALDVLQPTGNPFLDLCIWKGRFPSRRAQFCTEFLKREPIDEFMTSFRQTGAAVSWQGVRRDESANRAQLPRWQRLRTPGLHDLMTFRPILHWTADNVFSLHRMFDLDPNPLYRQGMKRVGCFPCINSGKAELKSIFARYPDTIERLARWENIVAKASKHGRATFFSATTTPQGVDLADAQKRGQRLDEHFPGITDIAEWARTSRGGRQLTMLDDLENNTAFCTSQYGLCE